MGGSAPSHIAKHRCWARESVPGKHNKAGCKSACQKKMKKAFTRKGKSADATTCECCIGTGVVVANDYETALTGHKGPEGYKPYDMDDEIYEPFETEEFALLDPCGAWKFAAFLLFLIVLVLIFKKP